jgi:choline dehydrogenase-like flavoprotein
MPEDYDSWVHLGAEGWSFDELLPAFIKLEDEHDFPDEAYHGRNGPVPIYREPEQGWSRLDLAFRAAVIEAGYQSCADHNAPDATGVSPFAMHIRDGLRVSAKDGYLDPARCRANLAIRGGCQVDKLLVSCVPDAPTVRGVLLTTGERVEIDVGAEVIIACGAAHSPALLMRSGIGPAVELENLGIEVIVDLPVGHGLQDHAMIFVEIPAMENTRRSLDNRVTNCVLRYSSEVEGCGKNDMMMLANSGGRRRHGLLVVQQEQVFSRGRLSLCSRDPSVNPLIELQLLTDPRDLTRMEDALDRMANLLCRRSFSRVLIGRPCLPAKTDLCRIVTDTSHLCGTCRMGASRDKTTVVDANCRVAGVAGLRVIDASVIPTVPRANIYLTVIMIAEVMAARMAKPCLRLRH